MTVDPTTLRSLIARLEAGETGQELCARIVAAALAPAGSVVEQSPFNGCWVIYEGLDYEKSPEVWTCQNGALWLSYLNGDLLTSVDAAIEFTEAVLPGRPWSVNRFRDGLFGAGIDIGVQEPDAVGEGPVGAVLVLATLKALLASAAIDDGDKP